jgi:hypothetical protein
VQYISVKKYIINEALNGLDVGNVLYSLHGYLYAGGGGGSQGGWSPRNFFLGCFWLVRGVRQIGRGLFIAFW